MNRRGAGRPSSFLAGAALLGAVGLVVKVIGAFYRIPLTNILGTQGMGIYQLAYPVYSILLVLSTAGLPTAISKMVAERTAHGDERGARRVLSVSWQMLFGFGVVATALLLLFPGRIALLLSGGDTSAEMLSAVVPSLMAVAPAMLLVSLLSAYRGYFQGRMQMLPTALTQLLEQAGKLVLGLWLAGQAMSRYGVEYAAAAAMLGVMLSEGLALALIMGMYASHRGQIELEPPTRRRGEPFGALAGRLMKLALPIVIGASVTPIVAVIDNALVLNRLMVALDYGHDQALSALGILSGMVNTLVNMPGVLSIALATTLVPSISGALAQGNHTQVASRSLQGFKLAMMIGLPCAAGLYILAAPVLRLLYGQVQPDELSTAVQLMRLTAPAVFALAIVQSLSGVLQGLGRTGVPVIALACGAAVKIAVNYVLIGRPEIGILGAAIGTSVCYTVAGLISFIVTLRSTRMRPPLWSAVAAPLLSTAAMAAALWTLMRFLPDRGVWTLVLVAGGALVYAAMLLITGALQKQDLLMLPGGNKLERVLSRVGLWK